MNPPYQFNPYMLPMLASAAFTALLLNYVWRRRSMLSTTPFSVFLFCMSLWSIGATLEQAAVDLPSKIFWIKFQAIWQLPAAIAQTWFALEYANLRRWLTRRTLGLLIIPSLFLLCLILTNEVHHLIWVDFLFDGYTRPIMGQGTWILMGYAYLLILMSFLVFSWLFIQSPLHRIPVAFFLFGPPIASVAFMLDAANINPVAPMDPTVLAQTLISAMYALALFRFRMFDVLPVARETIINQMHEGLLVLDAQQRIVDMNPAAEKNLGVSAKHARGRIVTQLLPVSPSLNAELADPKSTPAEIAITLADLTRYYTVHLSSLKDQRNLPLGYMILLYDITEQKQTQAQLLEQQRALATFQERERLARELHDNLGQVLGYVKLQAQAARNLLAQDRKDDVENYLTRLIEIAQDTHAEVREYILSTRANSVCAYAFFPALQDYLRRAHDAYGIYADLNVPLELNDQSFEPMVAAQLLRIIQEAVTNVRKHAHATQIRIGFSAQNSHAQIVVEDDGQGFDAMQPASTQGLHFGLAFMRERAELVGGTIEVHSAFEQGTRVVITVPFHSQVN
jgi:PAS domain S-box-containing protein